MTCVGGAPSFSAIRLRKRIVSSCVPRPMTCDWRQVEPLGRQVGQHVDRVRDDQHDRVLLHAGLAISSRMPRNRSTLRLIRSSRLSSGLRRRPAVMQITSLVGMCS